MVAVFWTILLDLSPSDTPNDLKSDSIFLIFSIPLKSQNLISLPLLILLIAFDLSDQAMSNR